MNSEIKSHIEAHLTGGMRETALAFVEYLRAQGLSFCRDTGDCWRDKIYYWVQRGNECICFIAIADPDEPRNRWTVWSDDSPAYEDDTVPDGIKAVGWRHIGFCGSCGSCGGGRKKIIFGRKFSGVCGCTFRADNPAQEELTFLKEMVRLRLRA